MDNIVKISPKEAKSQLVLALQAGLVPMLAGSPGIGKSDIIRSVAEELNLKVIDHRLSTSDPTDLSGLPTFKDGRATFAPFDLFPLENDEVPEGYSGYLLFLDEINSAAPAVQAAAYKLALEREVGQHKLHDKCHVVAAGNLATDGAIVNRLGTAMQSRLVHLQLRVDPKEWLEWAYKNDVPHQITSYITHSPDKLHEFSAKHNDLTFPCPRTWAFLGRGINAAGGVFDSNRALMSGTIGAGPARTFIQYCAIEKSLVSMDEIMKNPETADIPSGDPATLYFIAGAVGAHLSKENVKTLLKYISRMPIEFQVITIKGAVGRDRSIKATPEIRKWITDNAKEFMS